MKRITLMHYRLDHGGIDRVASLLASGLAGAGYDVTLLLFCDKGVGEPLYRAQMDERVNINYLGAKKSSRTIDLLRLLPAAVRWIKSNPSDILLSTCNHMNWIILLSARLAKAPSKIILKTTNPIIRQSDHGLYAKLRYWGYAKAFQSADMTMTLSEAECRQYQELFPKAASKFRAVINPYVNEEMLNAPAIKPPISLIPQNRKIILSIGRFEPQKNMPLLIQSFAALNRQDCHLVILGDGALKSQCEDLAQSLNVEKNISMPGFVDNVSDHLHAADLYMMTSRYEGLPAVILEALAAGLPIITTHCFLAAREIIEPIAGCTLLEHENPQYIAEKMQESLDNQHIDRDKMKKAAQIYSIKNAIQDHIRLIETF